MEEPKKYVTTFGRSAPADEVFLAWTSGDLRRMVGALSKKTNPVDRHFLLMAIVREAYRWRTDSTMRQICREVAETHISEFPDLASYLRKEMGGVLPLVPTFQHLATILAEAGEYEAAIHVCRLALQFGLLDGTTGGFQGRIARIEKKMAATKKDRVLCDRKAAELKTE